ncbi:MAG: hypothetical protein ABMB14_15640 [Myxococcota bacterium]
MMRMPGFTVLGGALAAAWFAAGCETKSGDDCSALCTDVYEDCAVDCDDSDDECDIHCTDDRDLCIGSCDESDADN